MNLLVESEKFTNTFCLDPEIPLDSEAIERDAASEEIGWADDGIDGLEGELEPNEKGTNKKRLLLVDGNNLAVEDLVDCAEDRCELQARNDRFFIRI